MVLKPVVPVIQKFSFQRRLDPSWIANGHGEVNHENVDHLEVENQDMHHLQSCRLEVRQGKAAYLLRHALNAAETHDVCEDTVYEPHGLRK